MRRLFNPIEKFMRSNFSDISQDLSFLYVQLYVFS